MRKYVDEVTAETSAPIQSPRVTKPLVDTYLQVIEKRCEAYRANGDGARTSACEALLAELRAL